MMRKSDLYNATIFLSKLKFIVVYILPPSHNNYQWTRMLKNVKKSWLEKLVEYETYFLYLFYNKMWVKLLIKCEWSELVEFGTYLPFIVKNEVWQLLWDRPKWKRMIIIMGRRDNRITWIIKNHVKIFTFRWLNYR